MTRFQARGRAAVVSGVRAVDEQKKQLEEDDAQLEHNFLIFFLL